MVGMSGVMKVGQKARQGLFDNPAPYGTGIRNGNDNKI